MKIKKSLVIISALLFSILFLSVLTAALEVPAPPTPGEALQNIIKFITGDFTSTGLQPWIISKLFLVILLTTVLYKAAQKVVGKQGNLAFIISLVVSILGVNFLASEELVTAILLPYGTLAVALSILIPLVLAFYFIEDMKSSVLRRFSWAIIIAIFLGLWFARSEELGAGNWIYIAGGIVTIGLFLFDGTIEKFKLDLKQARGETLNKTENVMKARMKIYELEELMVRAEGKSEREAIKEHIGEIQANIDAIKTKKKAKA